MAEVAGKLAAADVIALPTARLYGAILGVPERYPLTSAYYRLLFAGQLGYELVQTFKVEPRLGPYRGAAQPEPAVPLTAQERAGLRWAALLAALRRSGKSMPIKDSWIAATALAHGLSVVTRNRSDFEKAGVEILDPFV